MNHHELDEWMNSQTSAGPDALSEGPAGTNPDWPYIDRLPYPADMARQVDDVVRRTKHAGVPASVDWQNLVVADDYSRVCVALWFQSASDRRRFGQMMEWAKGFEPNPPWQVLGSTSAGIAIPVGNLSTVLDFLWFELDEPGEYPDPDDVTDGPAQVQAPAAVPGSLINLLHRIGVDATIGGTGYHNGQQCITLRTASYDAMIRLDEFLDAWMGGYSYTGWERFGPWGLPGLPYTLGLRDARGVYGVMIPVAELPGLVQALEHSAAEGPGSIRHGWRQLWREPYSWHRRTVGVLAASFFLVVLPAIVTVWMWGASAHQGPTFQIVVTAAAGWITNTLGHQVWPWAARLRKDHFGGETP